MTLPLSVIMPIFNGEKFLPEAIDSILRQTFHDFEFLIDTTGSNDATINIIENYKKKDKRIRHEKNGKSQFLSAKVNFLTNLARGKYIARMDGDDISLPERFQKQIDYLNSHPEVAILGTNYLSIDYQGKPKPSPPSNRPATIEDAKKQFDDTICPIHHPTMMIRSDVLKNIGGYREEFFVEDLDLYTRLYRANYIFNNLSDVLFHYRIYIGSASQHPATAHLVVLHRTILWLAHQMTLRGQPDPLANITKQDLNFSIIKKISRDAKQAIFTYLNMLNTVVYNIIWSINQKIPDIEKKVFLQKDAAEIIQHIINLCQNDQMRQMALNNLSTLQTNFADMPAYIFDLFYQTYLAYPHLSKKFPDEKKQKIFIAMTKLGLSQKITNLKEKWGMTTA
ncbi:MAG: glycosyltransferase [Alphaproteobacteria bacterium]